MATITRQKTSSNIQTVADLVTDIVPYIDTLDLKTKFWLRKEHYQRLNMLCGGKVWPDKNPIFARFTEFVCKLHLQRPSDEAIEFLIDTFPEDEIGFCRLDHSVDYLTATAQNSGMVHHFFDMYQVKLYPGKQRVSKFWGTSYSSQSPKVNCQICSYSDKPTKAPQVDIPQPCFHFEYRLKNPQAIKRAGIERLDDLIDFNFRSFFEKRLIFQEIDFSKFHRIVKKTTRRKPREEDEYLERLEARSAHHQSDEAVRRLNRFRARYWSDDFRGRRLAHWARYQGQDQYTGEFYRPHGNVLQLKEIYGSDLIRKCVKTIPNDQFLPE